jgi:acetylornithine deacetylase
MSIAPPPLRTMMEQLIATPSISSTQEQFNQSNHAVVNLLATWLEDSGFKVEIVPIPDKKDKSNLIATLGRGRDGLVLSGHTDTVPCDSHLWSKDPFRLTEIDQRLYGLGSCDMKSFFALAIEAARDLAPKDLLQPLTLLATADEESSMSGARALTAGQLCQSKFAMIGEPTSLQPVALHKGIMMLAVRLEGKSGHSSDPALGINVLEYAAPVINAILDFRTGLQHRYRHPAFQVTFPTLNLGCIQGGDNPNRICGHLLLEIDLRVLPGMDNISIKDELAERLQNLLADMGITGSIELLHPPVASFAALNSSPLLTAAEKLTGVEPVAVAFATEAPFLQQLELDTIVMGPGSINQAHQPDEYIEMKHLQPTIDIIRSLTNKFCCS